MEHKAFTLITGILLLVAIMLLSLLALSGIFLGVRESEQVARTYHELSAFADGCAEEGLILFKRSASFTEASLSNATGSCTIRREFLSGVAHRVIVEAMNDVSQSVVLHVDVERAEAAQAVNLRIISYTRL